MWWKENCFKKEIWAGRKGGTAKTLSYLNSFDSHVSQLAGVISDAAVWWLKGSFVCVCVCVFIWTMPNPPSSFSSSSTSYRKIEKNIFLDVHPETHILRTLFYLTEEELIKPKNKAKTQEPPGPHTIPAKTWEGNGPVTYLCQRSPRHQPRTQTVAAAGEEAPKTHRKHSLQRNHLERERQCTSATPQNSRIWWTYVSSQQQDWRRTCFHQM